MVSARIYKFTLVSFAVLGSFLLVGARVLAEDGNLSTPSSSTKTPEAIETDSSVSGRQFSPKPFGTREGRGEKEEDGLRVRLTGIKAKACAAHQDEIKKRATTLMNLVSGMTGKFDSIAQRVENYYTTKVIPSGQIVPNYQDLINDVAAKKATVVAAIAQVPDTSTFSCTGDNPKGVITSFRMSMQKVKKALEEYRTSIKNLIVAVHSVVKDNEKPERSPIASPSASPI